MKFNKYLTILSISFLILGLSSTNFSAALAAENTSLKTSVEVQNLGSLALQKTNQGDTTQLILKKSPKITIVVDNYEGLEPHELIKYDLDNDGQEIQQA